MGHFQVVLSLPIIVSLGHILSYENWFYLHVNENLFSYEGLCT